MAVLRIQCSISLIDCRERPARVQPVATLARTVLAASILAMCLLTFVWPFAVSPDPADPIYRIAAISAFFAFLVWLAALLACKARRI